MGRYKSELILKVITEESQCTSISVASSGDS